MTEQKRHEEEENSSKCLQQPALRQAEAKDQERHPSLTAAGSGSEQSSSNTNGHIETGCSSLKCNYFD